MRYYNRKADPFRGGGEEWEPSWVQREVARPERFELPAFWFVARYRQNSNGLFGIAYEPRNGVWARL